MESKTLEERRGAEVFLHVIIAPGRFNKPRIPTVKGLAKFKGATSIRLTIGAATSSRKNECC